MSTLLKNGTIYDGTGEKPFVADVLIDGGCIAKICNDITADVDRVIDCTGLMVAPGFIDAHSHNDFYCDREDSEMFFRPFIEQGITTQVTGNCGFSPFGVASDTKYKEKVGGGLFHTKSPCSFEEFCSRVHGDIFVNIVPLIGQGTTRISMSGYDPKPLSKEEIDREMELVDEAMRGGAFGGSFGFMYEPGIYAKRDELVAFARKIAEYDGILTVHPRACSAVANGYPLLSKPHIEIALDEVIDIMKESGVRTEYSHLIFVGKTSWKCVDTMLDKFHKLADSGCSIAYDNYPFNYGASVITVVLPEWNMAMSPEERHKKINQLKLKVMIGLTKKALGVDFSNLTIAYISDDPTMKKYEGRKVSDIAKDEGKKGLDMYIKLVELSNGQGRVYFDGYYNKEIVKRLMEDKLSVFMTDAWVEEAGVQNGSAYQAFPYFLLIARENGMPLENIIHKMTGATATRFGIPERGTLKEGNFADITVFDYKKVKVDPQVPDFRPEGIEYVFVNGIPVLEQGEYRGGRAGKVVLKPKQERT